MKIKQKIIVGTLSIVTVLGFGVQLPVSATGNRPGVFQEQFFPDEHNIADELWAKAERTDTAEDWEAAAEACDKAHKAYEKSGNMEIAREFFANTYKAAAKSSQKVAEKISYNLSSFSAEELEKKRDQAINNWNLAAECYEEAARLFRNTEARDDEDKICEKLAKEVRANADFDTALAAWEKANKVNTVESWNNAGQLFDQAAQSCRDAGFIEKSSSCDNKSREAFKKIESIKKSSIDTDLEEDTNVANQTEQVVVENEKVNETSTESFFKQAEDVVEKTNSYVAIAQKDCNKVARLYKEAAEVLQVRANTALKEAIEANTIESWNKAAKLYEETAEAFEEDGKDDEANVCIVMSKLAYAKIALKEVEKADTIESWNKVAKINKEFAEEYKKAGDEKEANKCLVESKQAYSNVAVVQKDWNKFAEINKELAEEYKTAGDEKEANMCILNSKRAYSNVALAQKNWNEVAEISKEVAKSYEKLAEEYKKAFYQKEANACIAMYKLAYAKIALKKAKEVNTIEGWNEADTLCKEAVEAFKNAGEDDKANKFIAESKYECAYAALEKAKKGIYH